MKNGAGRVGAKVITSISTIPTEDWSLLFLTLGMPNKLCYGCAHCLFFFEGRSGAQIVPDLLLGTAWGPVYKVLDE